MSESSADLGAAALPDACKPRLALGVRMQLDTLSGQHVLLFPEAVVELKGPGAVIVSLCDGQRSLSLIVAALCEQYRAPAHLVRADVGRYIDRLWHKHLVDLDGATPVPMPGDIIPPHAATTPTLQSATRLFRPLGLIAELTYLCPLHCPYCSNPTRYPVGREELNTEEWSRVLRESAGIGVLHALFSGGEPLVRKDLESLVTAARQAGLYTNLITSALGLSRARAQSLKTAGLDSVQISFQADTPELADSIAGAAAHVAKLEAARLVRELGLPLTVNVVLHRSNIDNLDQIIALAEQLARRLELANTQFYGWAFQNRNALLPSRLQIERAAIQADAARRRLGRRMQVLLVAPDYFGDRPKPCMNGWGRQYIAVNPVGDVLPCPTAYEIAGLSFENVRQRDMTWIWRESEAFNRFRGTSWMPEPCRSCDQRDIDFGGCRCQAALLTGDPANTDPACSLSRHHGMLVQLRDANSQDTQGGKDRDSNRIDDNTGFLIYRGNPE